MKKAIVVLLLCFAAVWSAAWSQEPAVDRIFEKYSEKEGFTVVDIAKGLFDIFAEIDAEDDDFDEFKKAVEGIEKLRLIAIESDNGNQKARKDFYEDVINTIPVENYKELMTVREGSSDIKFLARNEKQVITEMLMIVNGENEAVLMSLTGNIDLNHIAALAGSMNLQGMEHLRKMEHDNENDQ